MKHKKDKIEKEIIAMTEFQGRLIIACKHEVYELMQCADVSDELVLTLKPIKFVTESDD